MRNLQLPQQLPHAPPQMRTTSALVREEGLLSLYRGLTPALLRGLTYGSLRLGLYEPCKNLIEADRGQQSLALKIGAGALAGSVATALTSPMELIKVEGD